MPAKKKSDPRPRARIVSVFGPFASRALVDMSVEVAQEFFETISLAEHQPTSVIDAVERDLAAIAKRDEALAESGLAASAVAMAYEIAHPYNSATSKSMCARALVDALERLRELAPDEEQKDGVDDLSTRRAARLAGRPAA